MLCLIAKKEDKRKFGFKIRPGELLRIYGYEISKSEIVTERLVKHNLDSIEGRLSFFADGRYPSGAEKYTCGITIAIGQGGRVGLSMSHVECWPHDPNRETRRAAGLAAELSLLKRIKNFLN